VQVTHLMLLISDKMLHSLEFKFGPTLSLLSPTNLRFTLAKQTPRNSNVTKYTRNHKLHSRTRVISLGLVQEKSDIRISGVFGALFMYKC